MMPWLISIYFGALITLILLAFKIYIHYKFLESLIDARILTLYVVQLIISGGMVVMLTGDQTATSSVIFLLILGLLWIVLILDIIGVIEFEDG